MLFSILVLSVSLSIDALFVGFAYALDGTRIPFGSKMIICFFSILYAGIAVFAGSTAARFLPAAVGRAIGAGMLFLIGCWMILKGFVKSASTARRKESAGNDGAPIFRWMIRSLGVTVQILRNPDAGDIDRSGVIDLRESILLGSALSVDAIGVGIGSALSGLSGWYIPLSIGLCQLLFLSTGLAAGKRFGFLRKNGGRIAAVTPGLFLLALAALRLL